MKTISALMVIIGGLLIYGRIGYADLHPEAPIWSWHWVVGAVAIILGFLIHYLADKRISCERRNACKVVNAVKDACTIGK